MKPRALLAFDKFKGCLSAEEACAAAQRGLGAEWQVDCCPIADGGEGFVTSMVAALSGRIIEAPCHDALGRAIMASYGLISQQGKTVAVMEMAAASGLWRILPEERKIRRASTYGTGEMMRHAMEHHAVDQIIMGIGGSATNDGGAGMAAALGVKFLDAAGEILNPAPADLGDLVTIDTTNRIALPEICVACDVDNPLCGPHGAAAIYAPQKGATADDVTWLDAYLQRLAQLSGEESRALTPGAGAAGGLGFGLLIFCNATLQSGFEMIAEALDLEQRARDCDIVITGEGSLDAQSLNGKGPVGIAQLAARQGKPCIAVAGIIAAEVRDSGHFADHIDVISLGLPLDESIARAAELLEKVVHDHQSYWLQQLARSHPEGWKTSTTLKCQQDEIQ